jgi:hypothetical protein
MPVGLNGRLLVKIAPNSDPIRPGDFLTTSDIPGRAMKANHAGEVIGKAMDNWDSNSGKDKIIVFIEQGYFNGLSDQVMAGGLSGDAQLTQFIDVSAQNVDVSGILSVDTSITNNLVVNSSFMVKGLNGGDVFSIDSDGNAILKGTLTVDKIKANQVEGLQILTDELVTDKISSLKDLLATDSALLASESAKPNPIQLGPSLENLNVLGMATVSGQLNAGSLRIHGSALVEAVLNVIDTITTPRIIVSDLATFFSDVVFNGNVSFFGRPTFNADTAGFAVIKKGEKSVDVIFDRAYDNKPVVTAAISLDENADATESAIFSSNMRFIVTKTTTKGFTIVLDKPISEDISFSWSALSVKDPQTFTNKISQIIEPTLTPTVAPASVSTSTPTITQAPQDIIPSVTPIVTPVPQQDASQSATLTP